MCTWPQLVLTVPLFWLHVYTVFGLAGCPVRIRADCGSENVTIAACQMLLQHHHHDRYSGPNSFVFGSCIRNTVSTSILITLFHATHSGQRIESWWSRLRCFKTDWWINLFKVFCL